jgi:alpha-N-acetylglucosamine transferase
MATFKFEWKLIDGDKFEQSFAGFETMQAAFEAFYFFWGVTDKDCSEFHITETPDVGV